MYDASREGDTWLKLAFSPPESRKEQWATDPSTLGNQTETRWQPRMAVVLTSAQSSKEEDLQSKNVVLVPVSIVSGDSPAVYHGSTIQF